ncbi:MAG: membrane protein insertion efficiency factor YidD [Firmicutes bacterium]|nr:membrane protein insertion efficiency factor YidD [Bacillota bacterium]
MKKILHTLREIYIIPIRIYQHTLSALIGNRCGFTPTCSTYAMHAIKKRGIIIGTIMGGFRILKCNPFSKGGNHYVPDRFKDIKHVL